MHIQRTGCILHPFLMKNVEEPSLSVNKFDCENYQLEKVISKNINYNLHCFANFPGQVYFEDIKAT